MGRQMSISLTYDEEQSLVDQLHQDGFVVVPERLPSPRLWQQVWENVPLDDHAKPWEQAAAVLPDMLARTRQACFVGLVGSPDLPPGPIPTRLAYSVNTSCLPSIEWDRNRRSGPRTLCIPGGGGRLYIDTQRDYGPDEHWHRAVITEYDKMVRFIKKLTVFRGKWGYWSKQLDPPPSDEEYQRLLKAQNLQ